MIFFPTFPSIIQPILYILSRHVCLSYHSSCLTCFFLHPSSSSDLCSYSTSFFTAFTWCITPDPFPDSFLSCSPWRAPKYTIYYLFFIIIVQAWQCSVAVTSVSSSLSPHSEVKKKDIITPHLLWALSSPGQLTLALSFSLSPTLTHTLHARTHKCNKHGQLE